MCPASQKEAALCRILEYEDPDSAIIFCNTKADVRFVTAYLGKRGFNTDQISGDLAQSAREKAMTKIKAGKLRFLVATDVAARGIDISDLAYVINYTTSDSPEVYIHRTGRTGRAGKSGVAVSLISGLDIGNFKHMQIVNDIKIIEKKVPTERDLARRAKKREQGNAETAMNAAMNALKERARLDLESLASEEASSSIEGFLPIVTKLAENEEGLRELASLCAAYSLGNPTKTIESSSTTDPSDSVGAEERGDVADSTATEGVDDGARADETPDEARRRRRRSGRGGKSGSARSGDGRGGNSNRPRVRGGSGSRRS
jgi:ATP-dependent RNA helicase DeaD